MMAITHVGIALLLGRALGLATNWWDFLFLALASLLPDIDMPAEFGLLVKPLAYRFHRLGHRALTHSLIWVALALPAFFLARVIFFGIALHIALDMMSYSGVKLLFPRRESFVIFDGVLSVGKAWDYVVGIISLAIFGWLVWF
jgi:membrane-bound metal-dependent hydrolase YbcI (DUF457 family)